jgi:hypothetical protein
MSIEVTRADVALLCLARSFTGRSCTVHVNTFAHFTKLQPSRPSQPAEDNSIKQLQDFGPLQKSMASLPADACRFV